MEMEEVVCNGGEVREKEEKKESMWIERHDSSAPHINQVLKFDQPTQLFKVYEQIMVILIFLLYVQYYIIKIPHLNTT